MHLLLATNNTAKLEEMRAILFDPLLTLHTPKDFPNLRPVDETGSTYEENSAIKAISYAQQTGVCALADDSGLEVEALDGAPGVLSARYAGTGASDSSRIAFLLSQLETAGSYGRAARFVSVAALADANGSLIKVSFGFCEGQIIETPRGANGFGYDPIFIPNGFSETFAELTAEVKNLISHRARSLRAMNAFLKEYLTAADA